MGETSYSETRDENIWRNALGEVGSSDIHQFFCGLIEAEELAHPPLLRDGTFTMLKDAAETLSFEARINPLETVLSSFSVHQAIS